MKDSWVLVEVKWPENTVKNVKYYNIEMSLDYTRGKEDMKCPRCKKQYNSPWQECGSCITKYYPET